LDVISCWASDWQLKVSVEKCNNTYRFMLRQLSVQ